MSTAATERDGYFATLFRAFGQGWNRFWFTPTHPLPLAVLRIGVGAVALYLIASYGFDLRRMFDSDVGLLRLDTIVALQQGAEMYRFSYLDHLQGQNLTIAHYAGLAVVLLFTLGLFTRLTAIGALVVLLSYMHRGPMLTGIVEPVVAYLMFYLCLSPCGAVLSLDALWKRRRAGGRPVEVVPTYAATVPLRLIQVHTSFNYFLMFCGKMQASSIWWNGTAAWWLIARPESALVDLRWLNESPYLVYAWTTSIFLFEPVFAVLIWNRYARPLLIALSALHWLGIALLTGLAPFSVVMFLAGLSFVPASSWARLFARVGLGDWRVPAEPPGSTVAA